MKPDKKSKSNFWTGFKRKAFNIPYSKLPQWHRRIQEMQKCATPDALVTLHGPPKHKVPQNGFEIWHYPLGIESGMAYSIHVSVSLDKLKQVVKQVFLYFEPVCLPQPRRRWWQFWKKKNIAGPQQSAAAEQLD